MKKTLLMVMLLIFVLGLSSCNGCEESKFAEAFSRGLADTYEGEEQSKGLTEALILANACTTVNTKEQNAVSGNSFYSYKDFNYGYILFSAEELQKLFDTSDAIKVVQTNLELKRHEYFSAYETNLVVAVALGDPGTEYAAIQKSYEEALSEGNIVTVTTANSDATGDSLDVTPLLEKAVAEKWLEKGKKDGLAFYVALEDTTTEHSVEWFGGQGNSAPVLKVGFTQE